MLKKSNVIGITKVLRMYHCDFLGAQLLRDVCLLSLVFVRNRIVDSVNR